MGLLMGLLNIAGLLLSLAGVILLFFYGMPYRLQLLGEAITTRPEPGDEQKLTRYKRRAGAGLSCIALGTALQVIVTLRTMLL